MTAGATAIVLVKGERRAEFSDLKMQYRDRKAEANP